MPYSGVIVHGDVRYIAVAIADTEDAKEGIPKLIRVIDDAILAAHGKSH